jgi:hypothetical protein
MLALCVVLCLFLGDPVSLILRRLRPRGIDHKLKNAAQTLTGVVNMPGNRLGEVPGPKGEERCPVSGGGREPALVAMATLCRLLIGTVTQGSIRA